jgi:hypothetical protein
VPSHGGWAVDVGDEHRSIAIPDTLDDVGPGDSARAIAHPKRGHPAGATALFITGIPLSLAGALFVGASMHDTTEKDVPRTNTIGLGLGIGLLAVGIPMIVGGATWSSYSHAPWIEVVGR